MIKFTDETILEVMRAYGKGANDGGHLDGISIAWRAAAAVFETTANGQGEPEPKFVVGKRYRCRDGSEAVVVKSDNAAVIYVDAVGRKFAVTPSGQYDGRYPEGKCNGDLLSGAIDDELAEGAAMTDEQLADGLCRFAIKVDPDDGWLSLARRARELLLPVGTALAANQCHDGYGDEGGSHRCREVDTWKIRAERAEVAIEQACAVIEGLLRFAETDEHDKVSTTPYATSPVTSASQSRPRAS